MAKGELDCLIGGPPCQGFSQMRRSEERWRTDLFGSRGYNKLMTTHGTTLCCDSWRLRMHCDPRLY